MSKKSVFLICGLIVFILFWQLGLHRRFNYLTAQFDIYNKNPRLLVTGQSKNIDYVALRGIGEKYGLYEINLEEYNYPIDALGIKMYQNAIKEYLEKRNGKDWESRYIQELNKVRKEFPLN